MLQRVERSAGEEEGGLHTITLPTHLKVEDTLFRVGQVKVTARQFIVLLAGGSLIYTLWVRTAWFATSFGVVGMVAHGSLIACCCLVLLALAFGSIADRTLDSWLLLLLVYWLRPRVYIWSNLRREPECFQEVAEAGEEKEKAEDEGHMLANTSIKEGVLL